MALEDQGAGPYLFNVRARKYGAKGDGVNNDGPAIQAALNDAAISATNTAQVWLPQGLYLTTQQIKVPNKVIFKGSGLGSTIRATTGFPTNTALVRLGLGDSATGNNGYRVESMVLDCGAAIAGSIGLYSNQLNEVCGARDLAVLNHMLYGIHFANTGLGAYNWMIEDVTIGCHASATNTDGIRVENSASPAQSMNGKISRVSIVPAAGAAQQTNGIHVLGTTTLSGRFVHAKIDDVHVENVTNGVFMDHESFGYVLGIDGQATVGSLVRINNDSAWASPNWQVAVFGAFNNGGGVAVTDVLNSYTTTARTPFYVSGVPIEIGIKISSGGDMFIAATGLTQTTGFTYIPAGAGPPTGVPTQASGTSIPLFFNTTNLRLQYYRNGGWHYIAETA